MAGMEGYFPSDERVRELLLDERHIPMLEEIVKESTKTGKESKRYVIMGVSRKCNEIERRTWDVFGKKVKTMPIRDWKNPAFSYTSQNIYNTVQFFEGGSRAITGASALFGEWMASLVSAGVNVLMRLLETQYEWSKDLKRDALSIYYPEEERIEIRGHNIGIKLSGYTHCYIQHCMKYYGMLHLEESITEGIYVNSARRVASSFNGLVEMEGYNWPLEESMRRVDVWMEHREDPGFSSDKEYFNDEKMDMNEYLMGNALVALYDKVLGKRIYSDMISRKFEFVKPADIVVNR